MDIRSSEPTPTAPRHQGTTTDRSRILSNIRLTEVVSFEQIPLPRPRNLVEAAAIAAR